MPRGPNTKRFWILWTYAANYVERPIVVDADSAEEAIDQTCGFYSKDFQQKATIYVFDREPVFTRRPA